MLERVQLIETLTHVSTERLPELQRSLPIFGAFMEPVLQLEPIFENSMELSHYASISGKILII